MHLLGPLIQCWIEVMKADIFLFCLILGEKHWIFTFNFNVNWLTDVYECEWDVHYHSPKHTSYQQCHYICSNTCWRDAGTPEGSGHFPGIEGRRMQCHQCWLLGVHSQKTLWYLFREAIHLWSQPEHFSSEQHSFELLDPGISFGWLEIHQNYV